MKESATPNRPLLDGIARTVFSSVDLGLPDDPATMTAVEIKALFGKAIKVADDNASAFAGKGTPLEYRPSALAIARELVWNRILERGDHDAANRDFMIPILMPVHNVFLQENVFGAATEAEIDSVMDNLNRHYANGVLTYLMNVGICRPGWGARALTRPDLGAGIEASWWNLYLRTAGGEMAYEALGEAILNVPLETAVWSPGPAGDLSWLDQYAVGYTQGFVSGETWRAFLAKLKTRALAAKGVYRVKGQKVYAALVDQWFVGTVKGQEVYEASTGEWVANGEDKPPRLADLENL